PLPVVSISGLNASYCVNATAAALTGIPSGGTFSGNGISGNSFYPALAGVNTHYITYTYTDANGCSGTDIQSVIVNPLPIAFAGPDQAVCEGGNIALSGSELGGGVTQLSCTSNCAMPSTCANASTVSFTYEYITNVSLNGASQSSGGSYYTDYSSSTLSTLFVDSTYTISGTAYVDASDYLTAFIDWNRNGTFETGESITIVSGTSSSNPNYAFSQSFTVPSTAVLGESKLRLILQWNSAPSACTSFSYGEVEDYRIEVKAYGTGTFTYAWSGPNNFTSSSQNPVISSVTSANAGTYTLTVTDGNGCMGTDNMNVTVNPLPVVSISGLNASYCVNATAATLSGVPAGGTFSGTGMSGNVFYPALAGTGTYNITYTYTDANSCTNSHIQSVTVNSVPTAVATSSVQAICVGGTATLTATGGGTYMWSHGPTTAQTIVNPTVTTIYTVTVTNTSGCQDVASVTVTVNPLPVAYNVTGGGTHCQNDGVTFNIGLSGSEVGVLYQLKKNGVNIGNLVGGSGSAISFGLFGDAGAYTVVAANSTTGCTNSMSLTANINVNPAPPANAGNDATVCQNSSVNLIASGGLSYHWSTGANTQAINIAPALVTTTYFVTVTDVNGCSATDDVTIFVNPLPLANAGNDTAICRGDTTILTATGGIAYQWNTSASDTNASISVWPLVTTIYEVLVFNQYGCSDNDTVIVTVNPNPVVYIGPDITVPGHDDVTLNAGTGFDAYLWSNGATTQTVTVDSTGVGFGSVFYSVTVTLNGCTAEDQIMITFYNNIGLNDETIEESITIYPNPSKGMFAITITGFVDDIDMKVYNDLGQLLIKEE
ncbi:GEVED domain-containing protein, partial [candidate division KSB1 bacterium]